MVVEIGPALSNDHWRRARRPHEQEVGLGVADLGELRRFKTLIRNELESNLINDFLRRIVTRHRIRVLAIRQHRQLVLALAFDEIDARLRDLAGQRRRLPHVRRDGYYLLVSRAERNSRNLLFVGDWLERQVSR